MRDTDPSKIFKWCLDRVTDTNGNYVKFTYSKDNGQIYIERIDYTGNTGVEPTKSVRFYRDNGIDSPEKYDAKFKVKTTKRLKTIAVYAADDHVDHLVRAYAISYSTSPDTHRNLLTSVQQFGSDATLDNSEASFGTVLGALLFLPRHSNGQRKQATGGRRCILRARQQHYSRSAIIA